jgi:hypothetical protein
MAAMPLLELGGTRNLDGWFLHDKGQIIASPPKGRVDWFCFFDLRYKISDFGGRANPKCSDLAANRQSIIIRTSSTFKKSPIKSKILRLKSYILNQNTIKT